MLFVNKKYESIENIIKNEANRKDADGKDVELSSTEEISDFFAKHKIKGVSEFLNDQNNPNENVTDVKYVIKSSSRGEGTVYNFGNDNNIVDALNIADGVTISPVHWKSGYKKDNEWYYVKAGKDRICIKIAVTGKTGLAPRALGSSNEVIKFNAERLKPQNLGIINQFTRSELISTLKSSLDDADDLPDSIKECSKLLCDKVNSYAENNVVNINELIIACNDKVYTEEYDISEDEQTSFSDALEVLKVPQINSAIVKNFGEALGAIFLLRYVKGAKEIAFGSDKAEAMIDYKLTIRGDTAISSTDEETIGISAKALKGGHAPSIKELLTAIKHTDDGELEDLYDQNFVYTDDKIAGVKQLLSMLIDTLSDSGGVKNQYIEIIKQYSNKKSTISKMCNLFGVNSLDDFKAMSDEQFYDKFDSLCDNKFKKLQSLTDEIASECGVNTKVRLTSSEQAKSLATSNNRKPKYGVLFYPLITDAVKEINSLYGLDSKTPGESVDIFTAIARHHFSHRQLYLGVDLASSGKKIKFKVKVKPMDECNWEIAYDGPTINRPFSDRLAIKVVA